jgi:hypothetical protein
MNLSVHTVILYIVYIGTAYVIIQAEQPMRIASQAVWLPAWDDRVGGSEILKAVGVERAPAAKIYTI